MMQCFLTIRQHQRQHIRSADDRPRDGPVVIEPLSLNIPAEETHSPRLSTPVVSPNPDRQHQSPKSQSMTETSATGIESASSSQTQPPKPATVCPQSIKQDSPGGLGDFVSHSWKIPDDESPPPQRRKPTAYSNNKHGNEGLFYEDIHVNYHEIFDQDRTKHHRDRYDASLPEIWVNSPAEDAHITQPSVVLDERSPLDDNIPRFSWNDGPTHDYPKFQRQSSMESEESDRTVRPSDYDFCSDRNKENYPNFAPRYTTPPRFHWPTERNEVPDDQPKGLSDMYYETEEGKRADAWFAAMSSRSEPKRKAEPEVESADGYSTWPPESWDTTESAAYEYLGKRRSKRQSVIPESPAHGHVRKASDTLSVETVDEWHGITPGAPTAEVTEPESPAGEEVSRIACCVHSSRKKGAKKDGSSARTIC